MLTSHDLHVFQLLLVRFGGFRWAEMFKIVEMRSITSAINPCNDFFVIQAQGSWKCGQQRRRNEEGFQWCQETELLRNGIDSEEEVDSPECIQERCIFHCLLLVQRRAWQKL